MEVRGSRFLHQNLIELLQDEGLVGVEAQVVGVIGGFQIDSEGFFPRGLLFTFFQIRFFGVGRLEEIEAQLQRKLSNKTAVFILRR